MSFLEIYNIKKSYGGVFALNDISFTAKQGEVIAFVGDNGAGKSTLMHCLTGTLQPDSGKIIFANQEQLNLTPYKTRALGISMIYQDLALCRQQSVLANISLGNEITRFSFLQNQAMRHQAKSVLDKLHIELPLDTKVGLLSGGQQQAVAIARAMMSCPRLLIMDEPNAALGVVESDKVLKMMQRLKEKSVTIFLVTHRITEVFEISDRIIVMQQGKIIEDTATKNHNTTSLLERIKRI